MCLIRGIVLVLLFIVKLRWPPDKSIKAIINQRYNGSVLNTFRTLEKLEFKLKKLKADLSFLGTCSEYGFIPGFLNFTVYNERVKSSGAYRDSQKRFLKEEIHFKEKESKQMASRVLRLQKDLRGTTSFFDYTHLWNLIEKSTAGKISGVLAIQRKKLYKLGYTDEDKLSPDKVLFNLSSRVLNDTEKSLLSKGLKFVLPPKRLTLEKYLLTFEKLYKSLSSYPIFLKESFDSQTFKDDLRHLAFKSFKDFKKNVPKSALSDEEQSALKSLSRDDKIVITRPDKGNGVVLMDKSDYIDKVNLVLEDSSKFQRVEGDIFKKILSEEGKINRFVRKTFGGVDENGRHFPTYNQLLVSGSSLGILYGLPKIHKENVPIRPILSACNTPAYNLAKYLVPIISPLTKNEYTVPSTFHFAKEVCNLDFTSEPSEISFASFDVKSLFTNIPLNETINIILNILFKDNEYLDCSLFGNTNDIHVLNRSQFKELLDLACLDNHFIFNGSMYKQIDGVAMGSPLGPTLAMAFMCFMEEEWLSECPLDFKPLFYRRYVDDTFLIFKSPTNIQLFLDYLNSKHPNIKFTCDHEENATLPFLDMNIKHNFNQISTSMYRKPTFTGLFSKYASFTPILYKKNLVSTLTFRAFKICSDYFTFDKEINFIKSVLQLNGYPLSFIELHIKKTLNRLYTPFNQPEVLNFDVPKPIVLFPTYFLGDVSKTVSKELSGLVCRYYPQIRLRLIYKSLSTVGSAFKLKDKMPKDCMSCLIYQYKCDSCNAIYIGKTEQNFRCRISQHQGVSFRTGASLSTPVQSDIREHCLKHRKHINIDNFSVLDKLFHKSDLLLLESLHQKTKKPSIGTMSQSTPLAMFD
jgi:hypothetical protein